MINEINEEIWEMLEKEYTDEQIVGELIRLYQIETNEARTALDEALNQWFIFQCPF